MGSTVKLANDLYLETSSIVHNGKLLSNILYPIGSIYLSINNINPTNFFGGTWEQIKDRFLLSAGDTYTAGSIGGEATHTLTVNEMPSHNHYHDNSNKSNIIGTFKSGSTRSRYASGTSGGYTFQNNTQSNLAWGESTTSNTGGGQAHNNMPPYLTVYVWKRTA